MRKDEIWKKLKTNLHFPPLAAINFKMIICRIPHRTVKINDSQNFANSQKNQNVHYQKSVFFQIIFL